MAENQESLSPENVDRLLKSVFPEKTVNLGGPEAANELRQRLEAVLNTLTYREREIIYLRYGLRDGEIHTLEEVGEFFKVTRERVRQIEYRAIGKLRHPVRVRMLERFLKEWGKENS